MTVGQVYTVPRPVPALEREMASEHQVEHLFGRSTSIFREDPHPSRILRTRSEPGHRLGELYLDMREKDTTLGGLLRKRFEAVIELPRRIDPADSSPEAAEAADFCRRSIESISGFSSVLNELLYGRSDGVAFAEVMWGRPTRGPLAGAWVPVDLVDRPMWRFAFRDRQLHVRRPSGEPLPAPPGKFIRFTCATKDTPWGRPLLDEIYWYWWIKKHVKKFWAVFVEKWAQPTAIGKYPHRGGGGGDTATAQTASKTNQENQAKLMEVLRAIQSEMGIVIPQDLDVGLLEATRSGNDSYGTFVGSLDRGMALLIMGEVNTSGMRPGTGAYASEQVSYRIGREKVKLDAHDLAATTIRDQLLRPIVHLNLGLDVPVPRFVIDTGELEDRQQRMDGISRVRAAGEAVPRRYFYATHLVPEPREGEEVVEGSQAAAPSPFPSFPFAGSRAAARSRARLQAAPDLAELEANAEERGGEVEDLLAPFRAAITTHYTRHRELVEEAWTSGAAQRGEALRYVLARLDPRDLGESLLGAQAHGIGLSLQHLIDDGLGADLWSTAPGERLDLPLAVDRSRGRAAYLQAPPPSATTWSTAVDWWTRLLSIARSVFEGYEDDQRRLAFTVAGLEEASVLRDVHELVREGIAESLSLTDFRARLATIYEAHGLTPTVDWHADLVLNNNVRQAGGAVRYGQIVANPEGRRLVPYLAWHTLGDAHVRDRPGHNHAAMHGAVFAADHPIWRTWWYPAGHGCRCYVSTLTAAAARRMGLTGSEPTGPWPIDRHTGRPVQPDAGFRAAPNIAATVDQEILPRLRQHAEAAESTAGQPGAEDLIAAIRQLLDGLIGGAS